MALFKDALARKSQKCKLRQKYLNKRASIITIEIEDGREFYVTFMLIVSKSFQMQSEKLSPKKWAAFQPSLSVHLQVCKYRVPRAV